MTESHTLVHSAAKLVPLAGQQYFSVCSQDSSGGSNSVSSVLDGDTSTSLEVNFAIVSFMCSCTDS